MAQQQSQHRRQRRQGEQRETATKEAGQSEQSEQSEERLFRDQPRGLCLPPCGQQGEAGRAMASGHHLFKPDYPGACWQEAARFFMASAPYGSLESRAPHGSGDLSSHGAPPQPLEAEAQGEGCDRDLEVRECSAQDALLLGQQALDQTKLASGAALSMSRCRWGQRRVALRKRPLVPKLLISGDEAAAGFPLVQKPKLRLAPLDGLRAGRWGLKSEPLAAGITPWSLVKPGRERSSGITANGVHPTKTLPLLAAGRSISSKTWFPSRKRLHTNWGAAWLAGAKRLSRRLAC